MLLSILLSILNILQIGETQNPEKSKSVEIAPGNTIEMVYVPAGSFTMGNTGEEDQWTVDATAHQVTLTEGFWMAKYEITQKIWEKIMGSNPSQNIGDNLPVENVSWNDVMDFIGKIQGHNPNLDLPTEAQWEYACKAGTDKAYSRDRDLMTWHKQNSGVQTHPVGTKEPNLWGLHDIHGNVGEWVADWVAPFDDQPETNPTGPENGEYKVIKGGQHTGRPRHTYSYDRQRTTPDRRLFYVGFRIIMKE